MGTRYHIDRSSTDDNFLWCTLLMRDGSTMPPRTRMTMPFPKQKDPSITFLNKYGYNVVKLPSTDIEPMDVVGRDETTMNLGNIRKIWTSAVAQPEPGPARPTAAVNGMRTDALDVSFGLDILANALAAFGATVPSFKTAYQSAHTVNFAYTNVTTTSVSPFEAGSYLASGTLQTDNPQVTNYFFNENAQAYLILD